MTALSVREGTSDDLAVLWYTMTPTALLISGTPSWRDYCGLGHTLAGMRRSVHWWIGDWLLYGEHRWGEKFAQAAAETGFDEQTLLNDQWICRRIDVSHRRESIPFYVQGEVAALEPPEQAEVLKIAEEGELTRLQVRELVRGKQSPDPLHYQRAGLQTAVRASERALARLSGRPAEHVRLALAALRDAVLALEARI